MDGQEVLGGRGYAKIFPGCIADVAGSVQAQDLKAIGIDSYEDITDIEFVIEGHPDVGNVFESDALFATEPVTLDAAWIRETFSSYTQLAAN